MLDQAFLARFGQVVRQQQNAVGTQALGLLGMGDGHAGRATGTGNDRHLATASVHSSLDDGAVLRPHQRKVLPRSTGCKQGAGAVGGQPFQTLCVGAGAEFALRVEVGDGEGQQAGAHDGFEVLRGHGGHGVTAWVKNLKKK